MEMCSQLYLNPWNGVLELTKASQEQGCDPLLWAIKVSSKLSSLGVSLPSSELANLLVSHICWDNNVPIAWKFLEKAMAHKIVPSLLVLGLLSTRVMPYRHSHPAAFRLYMELLERHAFTLKRYSTLPEYQKIMNSLDTILNFSQIFTLQTNEPGVHLVQFVFSIVWQLVDASLDDEGLLQLTPEKQSKWPTETQDMDVDRDDSYNEKKNEHRERLKAYNTVMAIELIGKFLKNKVTSRILYLARQNMSMEWGGFILRIQLLAKNSLALRNSEVMTPDGLLHLISDKQKNMSHYCLKNSLQEFHGILQSTPLNDSAGLCLGVGRSAFWLPLDLLLEDAMDGYQVYATSAIEMIAGEVISVINLSKKLIYVVPPRICICEFDILACDFYQICWHGNWICVEGSEGYPTVRRSDGFGGGWPEFFGFKVVVDLWLDGAGKPLDMCCSVAAYILVTESFFNFCDF
ncbi:mediator of RNA polymerase II transcription subunit 33A-like [Olea europaea var. sylvestris]|uniref:mediator of RNA polymerase II transcription subunit 33A-like n=1 Tax=Olea europaea var. sylvestris TaxID=158386 RepID=UPI000C1D4396|nr:mediator of RNA polymerase II transcription subunit 33A-like [Olea europaea var. sylvestris]